jgi:hypothetical protein
VPRILWHWCFHGNYSFKISRGQISQKIRRAVDELHFRMVLLSGIYNNLYGNSKSNQFQKTSSANGHLEGLFNNTYNFMNFSFLYLRNKWTVLLPSLLPVLTSSAWLIYVTNYSIVIDTFLKIPRVGLSIIAWSNVGDNLIGFFNIALSNQQIGH